MHFTKEHTWQAMSTHVGAFRFVKLGQNGRLLERHAMTLLNLENMFWMYNIHRQSNLYVYTCNLPFTYRIQLYM